jgi:hypothetical protein
MQLKLKIGDKFGVSFGNIPFCSFLIFICQDTLEYAGWYNNSKSRT